MYVKTDLARESIQDVDSYTKNCLLQIQTVTKFHRLTDYQTAIL